MVEKVKKAEAEPVKIITPDERKRILNEGIKKTALPAFIGAAFALIFFLRFGDAKEVSWFSILLLVVLLSYYIQKLIYPLLGVRVKEFETKDWLYVEFFTVIFLLIFWTLLVNIGTLNVTTTPSTLTVGIPESVIASVTSDGRAIEGATVDLSGAGVNMSSITGTESKAYFFNVTPLATGNITVNASKNGYISNHTNIAVK